MSRRGVTGIAIVIAWVLGIAAFARRELTRSESERLTESALRVAPGATYFAVMRGGKHIGFASSTVDTLPARIQVTDYLVADVPARGGATLRRETVRARVRLTRSLALRDFLVQHTTDSVPRIVRGRVLSDTILDFVVREATGPRGRTLDSVRHVLRGQVTPDPLVPILTMVDGRPRIGRETQYAMLDVSAGTLQQASVRIAAETLFVVPDSAAYDAGAAKWRAAHNDSVRAWRLEGVAGRLWVDALGRAVRHERPDGVTLQRTAYELAFENWRAVSPLSGKKGPPSSNP
ncbi:MAG: hypothetical protein AB1762_18880 [Gemmatimonadota bacterium]